MTKHHPLHLHTHRLLCGTLVLLPLIVPALNVTPVEAQSLPPAQAVIPARPSYPITTLADVAQQIGTPTLVSLHFKNAPLTSVLDELERQTGIKLLPTNVEKKPGAKPTTVTIDIDQQPYWLALRTLARNSGVKTWMRGTKDGRMMPASMMSAAVTESDKLTGPYVANGPFLLVANGVSKTLTQSISYNAQGSTQKPGANQQQLSISLTSYIDPKFELSNGTSMLQVDEVRDERGRVLSTSTIRPYTSRIPFGGGFEQYSTLLTLPKHVGKRISLMRGTLSIFKARQTQTWQVDDVLNATGATKTFEIDQQNKRFTLNSIAKVGNSYRVNLTIATEPLSADATSNLATRPGTMLGSAMIGASARDVISGGIGPFRNITRLIHLEDAQGKQITSGSYSSTGGGNNTEINMSFSASPVFGGEATEPVKLVVNLPFDYTEIKVPFEFTNLPLP